MNRTDLLILQTEQECLPRREQGQNDVNQDGSDKGQPLTPRDFYFISVSLETFWRRKKHVAFITCVRFLLLELLGHIYWLFPLTQSKV